jgi:hypothetical protein
MDLEADFEPNDRSRMSRLIRSVGIGLLVLSVAAIWVVSFLTGQPNGDGRDYANTLRQEFERISTPQGLTVLLLTQLQLLLAQGCEIRQRTAAGENRCAAQVPRADTADGRAVNIGLARWRKP